MTEDEQILESCQHIMETPIYVVDNLNGYYECTCPICNSMTILKIEEVQPTIKDITHIVDCGYVIAKTIVDNTEEEE